MTNKKEILRQLINIIENLEKQFKTDELAYLAMTSKAENPIRDKIAFQLQKKWGDDLIIAREWTNDKTNKKRADLAILNNQGKPLLIVEFKAHSSISTISQWRSELINDYSKNKKEYPESDFIFIMLANYAEKLPDNNTTKYAIKYSENINTWHLKNKSKEHLIDSWTKNIDQKINSKMSEITIQAGIYNESKVEILAFIHENISLKE